jgi:hypothetical protein
MEGKAKTQQERPLKADDQEKTKPESSGVPLDEKTER